MTTTISFKIRTVKHQIAACLREIERGVKWFILQLIDLEEKLSNLLDMQNRRQFFTRPITVEVKTGSESHTTNWRSASVTVNGKPIYQVLKPLYKPEWELVGNRGNHGKWCIAQYQLPLGAKVTFTAKANGKEPIEFKFTVGEIDLIDVDGYTYGSDTCGWIYTIPDVF